MSTGNIALVLLYEPATAKGQPVPLVRLENPDLTLRAAQAAIAQAEARADELSAADEFLGEVERAEARRLRDVLAVLIPGVRATVQPCAAGVM